MKKLFSIALLISLITATQAAFAMEAGEHNEPEVTGLADKEGAPELDETNRLIQALKETYGMSDVLPLIGEFAHWNAQQEFPEKLDPELETHLLKSGAGEDQKNVVIQNAWYKLMPGNLQYSIEWIPLGCEMAILPLSDGWERLFQRGLRPKHFLWIAKGFHPKHIDLLNKIWKSHEEGTPYQLDESNTRKFNLLPKFVQKEMNNLLEEQLDSESANK